jgi:uncharacterized membrane protein
MRHLDDQVDSDQSVANKEVSLCGRLVLLVFGLQMAVVSIIVFSSDSISNRVAFLFALGAVVSSAMSIVAYYNRSFAGHRWVSASLSLALFTTFSHSLSRSLGRSLSLSLSLSQTFSFSRYISLPRSFSLYLGFLSDWP